jgi:cobalt-zinc-cadmium efflux system outer membrane protein
MLALFIGPSWAQSDSLTLEEALSRARNHPSLEMLSREVEARKAMAGQAGRLTNPRLSFEAENFAGTGPLAGTDALETTTRLEQAFEFGGKRAVRKERAQAEQRLAEKDLEARERVIAKAVREAYTELLASQEKRRLQETRIAQLEALTQAAKRRREAGGGSVAEELKLRVEWSQARSERERAAGEGEAARMRLAMLMGESQPNFAGVSGDLNRLDSLPAWENVAQALERNPELTRWQAEREIQAMAYKAARSQNVPDLDVNAGLRHHADVGSWAVVGGVSVPLPIWNRNRGEVTGANLRVSGAEQGRQAARQELLARAYGHWSEQRFRAGEITLLRDELIPNAEKARTAADAAYAAGRFGIMELLDGHRLWFEVNERYLAALVDHHRAGAELDALTGANGFPEARKTP